MLFFQHLSVIPRSWAHIHIKSIRRDKIPISPNGGANFRQMGEQNFAKWGERISAKWENKFPPNGGTNFRQMGENCCEPGLIVLYCQYKLGGDNQ